MEFGKNWPNFHLPPDICIKRLMSVQSHRHKGERYVKRQSFGSLSQPQKEAKKQMNNPATPRPDNKFLGNNLWASSIVSNMGAKSQICLGSVFFTLGWSMHILQ